MVKQIIRDRFFLRQKSEEATEKDREIITDLRDTLAANEDRCIGMAANMREYLSFADRPCLCPFRNRKAVPL